MRSSSVMERSPSMEKVSSSVATVIIPVSGPDEEGGRRGLRCVRGGRVSETSGRTKNQHLSMTRPRSQGGPGAQTGPAWLALNQEGHHVRAVPTCRFAQHSCSTCQGSSMLSSRRTCRSAFWGVLSRSSRGRRVCRAHSHGDRRPLRRSLALSPPFLYSRTRGVVAK